MAGYRVDNRRRGSRQPPVRIGPEPIKFNIFASLDDRIKLLNLALLILLVWIIDHRYPGITQDAQIYAFQALARLKPFLAGDLYLLNTSQDQFTIFSPIYAWAIQHLGLDVATMTMALAFNACLYIAAWCLVKRLADAKDAWIALLGLVILPGIYGASEVFNFQEGYLSARLPAEALSIIAVYVYLGHSKFWGLLISIAAFALHPLMALPGFLVLALYGFTYRVIVALVVLGLIAALLLSLLAVTMPAVSRVLILMDPSWLDVVRERSQFLFLRLWSTKDWELNARPFLTLLLAAMTLPSERARKLCIVSMIIGGAGLMLSYIGESIGPVAIILQGQAWRWVWISGLLALALLMPAASALWRDARCGPIAALLLIVGWSFPPVNGAMCVAGACTLWSFRHLIDSRAASWLRWAALVFAVMILGWVIASTWTDLISAPAEFGREPVLLQRLRNFFGLQVTSIALAYILSRFIVSCRNMTWQASTCLVLCVAIAMVAPYSIRILPVMGTSEDMASFEDWRTAIPVTSNVLVAPAQDSGSFVWFVLNRRSYLSLSQSAGVVFSRATAIETARRSDVVDPILVTDWRIMSKHQRHASVEQQKAERDERILTLRKLKQVCSDPALDFVISPTLLAVRSITHTHVGKWKDWHLYACEDT
jgi:hypothetical protein